MLAGLIGASSGAVYVAGERMAPHSADGLRRRIGLLTETPGLWDGLTVRQNLMTFARLYGLDDPAGAVDAALERLDIGDRADDTAARLSKGLKQRVAIARTLLHEPDIVLLDEPTAGLDPESARAVRDLVAQLRTRGCAVLLCTHNLDDVDRLADRVAVVDVRLMAEGTPAALRARLFAPRVRIVLQQPAEPFVACLQTAGVGDVQIEGTAIAAGLAPSGPTVPDLVQALVAAGARIETVVRDTPSLEDVYVELIRRGGRRP